MNPAGESAGAAGRKAGQSLNTSQGALAGGQSGIVGPLGRGQGSSSWTALETPGIKDASQEEIGQVTDGSGFRFRASGQDEA